MDFQLQMKNSTCRHCDEAIHIGLSGNIAFWFHEDDKKDCEAEPNYEIKSLTSFELDFLVSEAWKAYKRLYPKIAIRAPGYEGAFDEFEQVKTILRLTTTLKENALSTEKKDSQGVKMEAITHSLLSKADKKDDS